MILDLTLDESELLIFVLGAGYASLAKTPIAADGALSRLIGRVIAIDRAQPSRPDPLLEPHHGAAPAAAAPTIPPAQAAPPAKTVLWARNKKGQAVAPPDGAAVVHQLEIVKVDRKDSGVTPRMIAIARNLADNQMLRISVWDPALFAPVANRSKQPWTYFLTTTADGKYKNLAGIEQ